jgi:hypothetical protein
MWAAAALGLTPPPRALPAQVSSLLGVRTGASRVTEAADAALAKVRHAAGGPGPAAAPRLSPEGGWVPQGRRSKLPPRFPRMKT